MRLVHPSALVERGAAVGPGTRVWQFSVIKEGARVGRDCNIGAHCYIEGGATVGDGVTVKNDVALWEGVTLGDGSFVGPNAVFTNDLFPRSRRLPEARHRYAKSGLLRTVRVGRGATIGAGAMVRAGTSIGAFAMIGLGAVVLQDVPAHGVVVGNPARRAGWACECGLILPKSFSCSGCGKKFRRRDGALARAS
jgi:acetyltransferase-like isoleucine patch superfamily enzyme